MDEEWALLEAIRDEPESDDPRLIYADWLEENGKSERAEFVRLQCQLAGYAVGSPQAEPLRLREQELLREYRSSWLGMLAELQPRTPVFSRGVVEKIEVMATDFASNGEWMFKAAPTIRHVKLVFDQKIRYTWGVAPVLEQIGELSSIEQIEVLDLSGARIGSEGVTVLARQPGWRGVRDLNLSTNDIRPEGLYELAASRHFMDLTRLSLYANSLRNPGAAACSRAFWPELKYLDLGGNSITADHIPTFGFGFPRVRALHLAQNRIGPPGISQLMDADVGKQLRVLNLNGNMLGDAGLSVLLASSAIAAIEELYLNDNHLSPHCTRLLDDAPLLALRHLDLRHNELDTSSAEVLLTANSLARLECLDLRDNPAINKNMIEKLRAHWQDVVRC